MSNYTNHFFKRLVIVLGFLLSFNASAQLNNFPVTCTPFFVPQYNLQWNNFYTSSNFLKINLYLKDNKQGGDVNVFLRFRLERVGVSIVNSPDFIATKPIKLSFGASQTLTGVDISENFLPQNLLAQGIPEDFVRNGGSLPDGLWTIYVTAYEADGSRGYRQISNEGVGQTMVFYGQPPMLLSPGNGSEIDNSFSPNFLFNWLPRAGAGVGGLSGIAYEFELWELDTEEDPNEVVAGKRPIFTSTVNSPMYLYNATKPFLVTGKRYAWRVRVIDASGNNKYENDGYSEVWAFRYGLLCGEVKKIVLSPIGGRFYRLAWESVKNSNKYEINWRVKGTSSWTIETSIENRFDFQLDDSQNYEFKVRSLCRNGETGAWSEVLEWSKDVVNTSKSSATGTTTSTTTSTPEEDLSKVLNPLGTTVTSSSLTPEQIKATKDEYDKAPVYKLNRCGMPVKSTTASCEVDQSILYAGTIDFPNPPKATMLYFNSYEIIVTGGNAAKGEGLLFFPYLMKRIPVEWTNITIRKGEDPEDPFMSDYGCIVGKGDKIQVQGSDASVLSDDLNKQFTALAAWLNDPGSFTGTFGEALKAVKNKGLAIKKGEEIDFKETKNALVASQNGINAWIGAIKTKFGSSPEGEISTVLNNLEQNKIQLSNIISCVEKNIPPSPPKPTSPPKKGGPLWFDNATFESCTLSDEQTEQMISLRGDALTSQETLELTTKEYNFYEIDKTEISDAPPTDNSNILYILSVQAEDAKSITNETILVDADRRKDISTAPDRQSSLNAIPITDLGKEHFKQIVSVWDMINNPVNFPIDKKSCYETYINKSAFSLPSCVNDYYTKINAFTSNLGYLGKKGSLTLSDLRNNQVVRNFDEKFVEEFFMDKIKGFRATDTFNEKKSLYSDESVKNGVRRLYENAASDLLNNFYRKTGLDYYSTKTISEAINKTEVGNRRILNLAKIIDRMFYNKIGSQKKPQDSNPTSYKTAFPKWSADNFKDEKLNAFPDMTASSKPSNDEEWFMIFTVGGTQGVKVALKNIDPIIEDSYKGYKAEIVIQYLDTFGVDENDFAKSLIPTWFGFDLTMGNNFVDYNYRGGVLAQWILQHQYGYKAFTDYFTYTIKMQRRWKIE